MTPTARTLDQLRREGWYADVVERVVPRPGRPHPIRSDLFGFADVLAVRPSGIALLVQCTAASGISARVAKILDADYLPIVEAWLADPMHSLEVWGWKKYAKANPGSRRLWRPRVVPIRAIGDPPCVVAVPS